VRQLGLIEGCEATPNNNAQQAIDEFDAGGERLRRLKSLTERSFARSQGRDHGKRVIREQRGSLFNQEATRAEGSKHMRQGDPQKLPSSDMLPSSVMWCSKKGETPLKDISCVTTPMRIACTHREHGVLNTAKAASRLAHI